MSIADKRSGVKIHSMNKKIAFQFLAVAAAVVFFVGAVSAFESNAWRDRAKDEASNVVNQISQMHDMVADNGEGQNPAWRQMARGQSPTPTPPRNNIHTTQKVNAGPSPNYKAICARLDDSGLPEIQPVPPHDP